MPSTALLSPVWQQHVCPDGAFPASGAGVGVGVGATAHLDLATQAPLRILPHSLMATLCSGKFGASQQHSCALPGALASLADEWLLAASGAAWCGVGTNGMATGAVPESAGVTSQIGGRHVYDVRVDRRGDL